MKRPQEWREFLEGLKNHKVTFVVRTTRALDRHGKPLKLYYFNLGKSQAVTPWLHPEDYPEDGLIDSICSRLGIDPSIFGVKSSS